MGLFRRRQETLNEQLLREAGLDGATTGTGEPPPAPESPDPPPFPVGDIHLGQHRGPRTKGEWDKVATVRAADLPGDRIEFMTLPNGDILVEKEEGDADLAPLADAVERRIAPPYRAIASRQDGDLWGVGAKRIEVAEFAFDGGDAIELSMNGGAAEVRVDGEPSEAQVPALELLGEREGPNYCVEAGRIDGDFWEVKATVL